MIEYKHNLNYARINTIASQKQYKPPLINTGIQPNNLENLDKLFDKNSHL